MHGRAIGHAARAATVEVAQQLDGLKQRLAVGVGAQVQNGQRMGCELARGVVALADLGEVSVSQRASDLRGQPKRLFELFGGSALPDRAAHVLVGDLGVQQDLQQLAE